MGAPENDVEDLQVAESNISQPLDIVSYHHPRIETEFLNELQHPEIFSG
jgi:hypothetical protein